MKKIFILIVTMNLLLLFGCSGGVEVQQTVIASGYDFTNYTKKGFLFTPEQYLMEYESIGLITIDIIPEVREVYSNSYDYGNEWIKVSGKEKTWRVKVVYPQEVLEELYNKAISMGADAVVRLTFDTDQHNNGDITFLSLKASGFAIKRKL